MRKVIMLLLNYQGSAMCKKSVRKQKPIIWENHSLHYLSVVSEGEMSHPFQWMINKKFLSLYVLPEQLGHVLSCPPVTVCFVLLLLVQDAPKE